MANIQVWLRDVSKPEGPVILPGGNAVVTEMGRGVVSQVDAATLTKRTLAHTGRPNGLARDAAGNLWIAESRHPALLKLAPAGTLTIVSTGPTHQPFLWPNDLCFGPDGALYMTDSGVLLGDFEGQQPPAAAYDVPIDGRVYRIDPITGAATLLDSGLRFANGIAFGPGGVHLYVNETLTGNIYRYRMADANPTREHFGNVMQKPPIAHGRVAGPDGMAFAENGDLYVAVLVQGDLTVLKPDGDIREHIALKDDFGDFPTNVAFGNGYILITEVSGNQLLTLQTDVRGLPLYA